MWNRHRKVAIAAGVAVAGLLGSGASPASAVQVMSTSPVAIDGWTISWSTGVDLAITQDAATSAQVNLEKTANFTAPNQGFQITFAPTSGFTGTAATQFVIPDETIVNDTGAAFNSFSFVLLNTTSTLATFDSIGRTFTPPTGSGFDFTAKSLTSGDTILTYTGTQGNGVTSSWGNGDASSSGDNLMIDAPAGSEFSLKELSSSGPGSPGTPGGPPSAVPTPSAAWQSLAGLGGLALMGIGRKLKRGRMT
jgi:hypothetical protein